MVQSDDPLIGVIEAGGTWVRVGVGRTWQQVRDAPHDAIATGQPAETLRATCALLRRLAGSESLAGVGVASFGPLDLARGVIGPSTPKLAWRGVDWRAELASRLGDVALGVDTDTDAAALAEARWGAGLGRSVVAYLTVGTGIGGGLVVDGRVVHGRGHPEMGHMRVPREPGDHFAGSCEAHGDCLEGLASGAAIAARYAGASADSLGPAHRVWSLEAGYLASAVSNVLSVAAAQVVILGGGVMGASGLLGRVRATLVERVHGYLDFAGSPGELSEVPQAPGLKGRAGLVGAFALARAALSDGVDEPGRTLGAGG